MIDDWQREQRRTRIGSSDAPALVGVDPYRTAADVWLRVTGRHTADAAPGMAAMIGRYLEHGILGWAEDRLGVRLSPDLSYVHPEHAYLGANLDALALALEPPGIVEVKTAGFFSRATVDAWGEDGTDQVPESVLVQVHHQLNVVNAQPGLRPIDWVLVPCLLVGRGFCLFQVRRNAELADALLETEVQWWRDYVVGQTPPPDSVPSLEVLKTLRREPTTVPVDPALVTSWLQAREARQIAYRIEDEALRLLIASLGEAEAGTCDLGTVSYLQQTRKAHSVAESTFRVARWKAAKGG